MLVYVGLLSGHFKFSELLFQNYELKNKKTTIIVFGTCTLVIYMLLF